MKYIKHFEHNPIIEYKKGDIVLVSNSGWELFEEPMEVLYWNGYHFVCSYILLDGNVALNDKEENEWCIDEKEIIRKITKKELNKIILKRTANKYNL